MRRGLAVTAVVALIAALPVLGRLRPAPRRPPSPSTSRTSPKAAWWTRCPSVGGGRAAVAGSVGVYGERRALRGSTGPWCSTGLLAAGHLRRVHRR